MILVTNVKTGETTKYWGTLMVAPNGMAFIKQGKRTIWCSASTDFVAIEV